MSPDLFGSKFFMGTVVKKYEENPLHFLMGKKTHLDSHIHYTVSVKDKICTDSYRIFVPLHERMNEGKNSQQSHFI